MSFILPFLKYLKPYILRLSVGFFCLIGAGFFGTSVIMTALPALNVLFGKTDIEEVKSRTERGIEKLRKAVLPPEPGAPPESFPQRAIRSGRQVILPYHVKAYELQGRFLVYADGNKFTALGIISLIAIFFSLVNGIFVYVSQYQLSYSLYRLTLELKNDLFVNVLRQDMSFFVKHPVGYISSRIHSDVYGIQDMMAFLVRDVVQQTVQVFFIILYMLLLNWKLTLVALLGFVPAGVILGIFARKIRKVTHKQRKTSDLLSAVVNESLHNMTLVKALCTEEREISRFQEYNWKMFELEMKRRIARFASSPLMVFLGSIALSGIMLLGGVLVLKQKTMPVENFIIYIALASQLYQPFKRMGRANVTIQNARVSAERISEVLAYNPTVQDPPESLPPVPVRAIESEIRLENLVFSYGDHKAINGINLTIRKGFTTAIVGRSGSGKTTLANLLMRFYDPSEGRITLDGVDLKNFRIRELRALYGIVSQETLLFHDTVASNIAYGCPNATREMIMEAARAAYADGFIQSLDNGKGYDAVIGPRGYTLSGGQRQRIAIARAFCRNPQILILDEATSALDNESEAAVQKALGLLMRNRTVVVIAHRLSTIMHADKIVVLSHGKIIEEGTHKELLEQGGHYAGLYRQGEFAE